jgi:glycosyltransferase involved in cell wall biosynthesis
LIANPTDVTAWQQAIDRLEHDHLLRTQLGANARATFERSYTWHERARAVTTGLAA